MPRADNPMRPPNHLITVSGSGKMVKTVAVLTLFLLLPVALGANPYRRLLKEAEDNFGDAPIEPERGTRAVHEDMKYAADEKTMLIMQQAIPGDVGDVKCPDSSTCPDGHTCCLHINGGFGCCPNPNGNCCDDYMSCCKSGKVCDVANNVCITPSVDILDKIFLLKSSSTRRRL